MDESMIASMPVRPKKSTKKSHLAEAIQPWIEKAKPLALQAAILVSCILTGLITTWALRRRIRHRFPEFEVEPRLGGAHAAGVGAVISFASATVPPASQRDQVPDYLRRY